MHLTHHIMDKIEEPWNFLYENDKTRNLIISFNSNVFKLDNSEESKYYRHILFKVPPIFKLAEVDRCFCKQSRLPIPHPVHAWLPQTCSDTDRISLAFMKHFKHNLAIVIRFHRPNELIIWKVPIFASSNFDYLDFDNKKNNRLKTYLNFRSLVEILTGYLNFSDINHEISRSSEYGCMLISNYSSVYLKVKALFHPPAYST